MQHLQLMQSSAGCSSNACCVQEHAHKRGYKIPLYTGLLAYKLLLFMESCRTQAVAIRDELNRMHFAHNHAV